MIKYNRDIYFFFYNTWIRILNTPVFRLAVHLLSQNGSPESLNVIFIDSNNFANNSGLTINFIKTYMVWIGSKKISKDVFHHSRWKLNRTSTTFDFL